MLGRTFLHGGASTSEAHTPQLRLQKAPTQHMALGLHFPTTGQCLEPHSLPPGGRPGLLTRRPTGH